MPEPQLIPRRVKLALQLHGRRGMLGHLALFVNVVRTDFCFLSAIRNIVGNLQWRVSDAIAVLRRMRWDMRWERDPDWGVQQRPMSFVPVTSMNNR